ncbi:uncharacterized protein LOC117903323 [Drosophila subobscura]|uniref:uncharacterized protein LOC117903323 n=1 Tax=Drosophila subobscura TaxID=7241 RepID=UPI00155B0612|nr:uncharacterized protein LOC117903323 [Drosophila subobscura]
MMAENSDNLSPKRVSSAPNGKEQTQPPAKKQATVSSIAGGLLDNLVSGLPPTSSPGQSNNPIAKPKIRARRISEINQMGDTMMNTGARVEDNFFGGQGYTLTSSKGATAAADSAHDADFVRNIRQKRFGNVPAAAKEEPEQSTRKRSHVTDEGSPMIAGEPYDEEVISLLSSDEDDVIIIEDDSDDKQQEAAPVSKR